jgi:hypothetical protein
MRRGDPLQQRSVLMVTLVMFFQQVFTIIAIEITADDVNVVGIVLCVVQFYQKCFSLYAVIMRLTGEALWMLFNKSGRCYKK